MSDQNLPFDKKQIRQANSVSTTTPRRGSSMAEQLYRKQQVVGSSPTLGSDMRHRYSRLASREEKKNIRSAAFYIALTVGALLLILFFGLPILGKFAGIIHDLRTSNQPVDTTDTTAPAPPILDRPPEVTNSINIEITGRSEGGATIKLFVNDKEEEVLANNEGRFSYKWALWDGENKISAKARDKAGNESGESEKFTVLYDNDEPELEITSPEDGKEFFGSKERQVTIQGKTESGSSITINDRIVAVDEDGGFAFVTTLVEGDNQFTLKAADKAGNSTEKSLTLKFTP